MKHPFDLPDTDSSDSSPDPNVSRRRALVTAIAGVGGLAAGASSAKAQNATTLAVGEEGGRPTTKAVGEEGGRATTKAVGEEGGAPTTRAVGEEGGGPHDRIRAAAGRITALLREGDLPEAYKLYATAKTQAAPRGLMGLLETATTQIEAIADFEVGRGIRILAGAPGNREAAKEIIMGIARMDLLNASRRAKARIPK